MSENREMKARDGTVLCKTFQSGREQESLAVVTSCSGVTLGRHSQAGVLDSTRDSHVL